MTCNFLTAKGALDFYGLLTTAMTVIYSKKTLTPDPNALKDTEKIDDLSTRNIEGTMCDDVRPK